MKVLFLHFAGESRDVKAARLAKSGAQLIVEEPRWPHYYEVARREKPVAIVIDFSRAPRHSLESADYISKAKDTRDLELFAIHVFDEARDLLKERVPKIQVFSERELASHIHQKLPQWEAERAAAEQAAREERLARAEEKRAAAAASRAKARERRLAAQAPSPAPPPAPHGAAAASPGKTAGKKAAAPRAAPKPKKKKASRKPERRKKPVKKSRKPARGASKPKRKVAGRRKTSRKARKKK
jgi:hypothetical protein